MGSAKAVRAGILLAAVIGILGGCAETAEQGRERGFGGYLYTAEEIPADLLAEGQGRAENFKCRGDFLYYSMDDSIYRHPLDMDGEGGRWLAEGRSQRIEKGSVNGGSLMDYTVSDNGDIFYVVASGRWSYSDQGGSYKVTRETLIRQDENGRRLYSFPVDGSFASSGRIFSECVALDGMGHAFLLAGDNLYVIDEEGAETARISMEGYAPNIRDAEERLLEGPEGTVYYCADSSRQGGQLEVYEVTEENNVYSLKLLEGEGWEDRALYGELFCSPWGLLYSGGDGILRRYERAEGTWRELLRWSDSDLPVHVSEIVPFSDEGMFVCDVQAHDLRLYALTRRPAEEVPEKVELVLACYAVVDTDMEQAVAKFNRMNDDIHITVEIYNGPEDEMRLDASIVSSDPPDLMDLQNMDIVKYAEIEALEDLATYLETSTVLDRGMFLENVLEGYTIGGRLVCIPARFDCRTVVGRESQAGADSGWDMEEVMAFAEEDPEQRLLNYQAFSYLLDDFCGDYIIETYIDWEEGRCSFESEDFCRLMEWLAERGDGSGEFSWGQMSTDALLTVKGLGCLYSWIGIEESLGEPYVLKGFPTRDGRALHHGEGRGNVAIVAGSPHKEEAWRFLEYLLGEHQEGRMETDEFFSSRRDLLDKMAEEAMEVEYFRDENGKIEESSDGPRRRVKWRRYVDGRLEDCYNLSQKEADEVLEFLGSLDFAPRSAREREILRIITEEMESYQKGYKSMEEVAAVIQNRAEVLLQEHRR